MKHYIPYQEIVNLLPIEKDDILLIGSDIVNLAFQSIKKEKEFDANKFINSFQNKLTEGTLLFPAYNNLRNGSVFDPKTTKPQSGTLSNIAFTRDDFVRTYDPFHSFMVSGKAKEKLSLLRNISSFGKKSVFEFLYSEKAKMLLIDVDLQHSFTFAHFVEEHEKVSYRKHKKYSINYIEREKVYKRDFLFYEKKWGMVSNLNLLENIFLEDKVISKYEINKVSFILIDLYKAFDVIQKDIRDNKARNLCAFDSRAYIKNFVKAFFQL